MITNEQKAKLKQAQRQAGLADGEYREALQMIAGVQSSTDARFSDTHWDKCMSYFEAIFWWKVDQGLAQVSAHPRAAFQVRGFWAQRNQAGNNSRDRFTAESLRAAIYALERRMAALGYHAGYCATIREKVTGGRQDAVALQSYMAALEKTLKAKERKKAKEAVCPF